MAAFSPSSLMFQIQGLQAKPLLQKCRDTEDIIKRTSTKELRLALPTLLQSIFSFENEAGWGLEKVTRSQYGYEFEMLRNLLGPEGPVLNLVYSLQTDPYTSYEFPIKCLPSPSRHSIEEGAIPLFYLNKLQMHGFSLPTLSLSAFELYMFHFAYALVSPTWQLTGTIWMNLYDFLYPTLIDDYLMFFLPLNQKNLPVLPHVPSPVRSPISPTSTYGRQGSGVSPISTTRQHRVRLFKPSFILAQKQHSQSSNVLDQTEAETWHSEQMLQIFVEFWLNQNSLTTEARTFSSGSVRSSFCVQRCDPYISLFDNFMPTLNHVKIVRLLVKYLHYFANSATCVISSPYQHRAESPLDTFKRSVIPQIVQKKLYCFLRYLFDRWPLDCYFRMVLETWLSYIQPWRYTNVSHHIHVKQLHHHDAEARDRCVEDKWDQFVEDNLLFYSVLYQEFLPRVYRMDLTSSQSAYMLFRVTKVFCSPNLVNLITKAESEVCGVGIPLNRTAVLGGSYLSASHLYAPIHTLPPHLADMEIPGFQYHPLFDGRYRATMVDVLRKVMQAYATVTTKQTFTSLSSQKSSWFWGLFDSEVSTDSGADTKRLPQHLEQAVRNICQIFNLAVPEELGSEKEISSTENESTFVEADDGLPQCIQTYKGPCLTTLGRQQIRNNLRRFQNWQLGDPDLLPVCSYENAVLVRLLYKLCSTINSQFGSQIWQLYCRQDFVGRLAKVYLSPPLPPDHRIKSPVSHQTAESLRQPRVSLRFLASYQTLVILGLLYALAYFSFGTGPIGYLLLLACGIFVYGLICVTFGLVK